MLSAVVCLSPSPPGVPLARSAEHVVRSLSSLVAACVAGVLRDVVVAGPPGLDLQVVADHAGCPLVEAAAPAAALAAALSRSRHAHVLILQAGYAIGDLVDELDDVLRASEVLPRRLRASGERFAQRLLPGLAPVVGVLASTDLCRRRMPCDLGALIAGFARAPAFRATARRAF